VLGCDPCWSLTTRCLASLDAAEASRRRKVAGGPVAELHTGHLPAPRAGRIGTTAAATVNHQGFNSRPSADDEIDSMLATANHFGLAPVGLRLKARGGLLVGRLRAAVRNVIGLSLPL